MFLKNIRDKAQPGLIPTHLSTFVQHNRPNRFLRPLMLIVLQQIRVTSQSSRSENKPTFSPRLRNKYVIKVYGSERKARD